MKKPLKPKPKLKRRKPAPVQKHAPRRAVRPAAARAAPKMPSGISNALILQGLLTRARTNFAAQWAKPRSIGLGSALPLGRHTRPAAARIASYSDDDREVLALLFLPFLVVASAIATSQSMRRGPGSAPIAVHAPSVETAERTDPGHASRGPATAAPPLAASGQRPRLPPAETALPSLSAVTEIPELARSAPGAPSDEIAILAPETGLKDLPASEPLRGAPEIATKDAEPQSPAKISTGICVAALNTPASKPEPAEGSADPEQFGLRLAAAARAQLDDFVIYDDKYRHISYPMGDVPSLFGVCTDVIVRAYRAVGLDLQALVHQARSGSGDTNIDHRRTEVLRRFFAAHGASLPVTEFAEDYRPGDIVTYYRPQNRRSRSHIAIVADVIAPSGRPMIIHNRGWGPQMEDGLFVDEITGHYRYGGASRPVESKSAQAAPIARPKAKTTARPARSVIVNTSYVPAKPPAATVSPAQSSN